MKIIRCLLFVACAASLTFSTVGCASSSEDGSPRAKFDFGGVPPQGEPEFDDAQ